MTLHTPVTIIFFNRPDCLRQVIDAVRLVAPTKIFLIADGPRDSEANDILNCAKAREVAESIDWPCEIHKNYAEKNLGCMNRVYSGLSWVFSIVDSSIILEDDCVPNESFFFCSEMLHRYLKNSSIFSISGDNFLYNEFVSSEEFTSDFSYSFSALFHCWGWATWRRSWNIVSLDMEFWRQVRDSSWLEDTLNHQISQIYRDTLDACADQNINTWAYRAGFSSLTHYMLNIIPSKNLVSNIGFRKNTIGKSGLDGLDHALGDVITGELSQPLRHPPFVFRNFEFERRHYEAIMFRNKCTIKPRSILPNPAGDVVLFGSNGDGASFFLYGFASPEEWGAWSLSNRAEIVIPLHQSSPDKFSLEISGLFFCSNIGNGQQVDFFINDQRLIWKHVQSISEETFQVDVSLSSGKRDRYLHLMLVVKNPVSPHELGMSEDRRRLGFGLKHMKFSSSLEIG